MLINLCSVQNTPLQRADDYKLFNFDFVAHILDDSVTLEVVLKMFYGLNVVENFQVPVEVCVCACVCVRGCGDA